ncbi:MAG: TolC family protein [Ferruginibacter sp.]
MKYFFLAVCCMTTSGVFNNAVAQKANGNTLSLKQCVEIGIQNNLLVKQSSLSTDAAKIDWQQSRLNMLPDANAVLNHGINKGRSIDPFTNSYINQQVNYASYGIGSAVLLFNGLRLRNSVQQTELAYEATKMDEQQQKDNLTVNIILAYLQVLTNEDLLTQSVNQAVLTKKQMERLEIMNKEGAIAPPLLYDLKGQYANDQLSIINNQNALQTAKLNLCQLMNIPYDKDLKIERLEPAEFAMLYTDSPETIHATALKQFAQVIAADLRKKSSEKAVKVATSALYPSLTFNVNLNSNYSNAASQEIFINTTDVTSTDYVIVNGNNVPVMRKQNNYESSKITYGSQLNNNLFSSFGLNLSIPIFNALQARNRIKLAKIQVKNSDLIEQTTKTQLGQAIDQSFINLGTAADRYKTLQEQVNAYTESFHAAEIRFAAGVGTSIDYLTAKNNLDRSNIDIISARYDYVLRTKLLDYYQGKKLW